MTSIAASKAGTPKTSDKNNLAQGSQNRASVQVEIASKERDLDTDMANPLTSRSSKIRSSKVRSSKINKLSTDDALVAGSSTALPSLSESPVSNESSVDEVSSIDVPSVNVASAARNSVRRHAHNRAPNFQASSQTVYQNSDRIAIFIDGSNLFYAASHLNIEVDYRRLLATLVGGRRLLRAYFYTGVDPQNEKQRGFLLWLNRHGHRVVSKDLAHLPDGSRKANMHVEMAVDMMRISEYCSTLTLLGGDGNLAYALQVLSQRGVSLEVVSLQSMTSDSLIDLADVYTDLADLRDDIKR